MSLENVSLSKEAITGASSKIFANALSDNLFKDNSGELDGGIIGNIFSSGVGSATNTIANNVMKGLVLTSGLGRNVGTSLASSGVGIGSNFIGQGIDSLGGHSMLSRGIGQGVATGLGTVGGLAVSNLIKYGTFAGKTANGSKAALIGKGAGSINPYGLAATVAGTALGAAFGPSKEYGGKYGSITQTMDTVYDGVTAAANFIPGWGQLASGFMTLNKGLSNIFGSTSGMTVQDAILGSAFMPAPVKWLNMANAKTTGGVDNYSWLNQEKLGGFMGDAFGDTWSKINKAVDESGKTYGTFSNSAYKDAQGNINYVNSIYNPLLAMANQNEYQGIRAFDMDTINNLRYSQWIQGGFKPITVGKRGMKIFNNATNHNIGMRLLSGAALIDNKQMILSAQGGTKILSQKPLEELVLEKQKAFNEKIVKPIMIGYDKNRAFTLTNAGSLTGAHLSEEMIEYIMSEAEKAGIDLQTALGIVGAESTFGNPTDDKSSWKISSGIRKEFNNVYPGTSLHINTNGDSINEQELVNFYYPLENQNPYTQQLNEAKRRAKKGEDYNKVLSEGMNYADKLALQPIPTGSLMLLAFEYFKKYGEKYNPNYLKLTGQSYIKHVLKKGKEALQSPEIQQAINNIILRRMLSLDSKQMIPFAQGGTKVARPPRMRAHRKSDESRGLTQEEQEWWRLHEEEQKRLLEEETAKKIKEKEEAADKFNQQTNTVMSAMTLLANETPFTGLEYQQTAEDLRQKKVEKFHEAEKIGEAAMMADLAAPLLLRSFRWVFNKTGLLVKVPIGKYKIGKEFSDSDIILPKKYNVENSPKIINYYPNKILNNVSTIKWNDATKPFVNWDADNWFKTISGRTSYSSEEAAELASHVPEYREIEKRLFNEGKLIIDSNGNIIVKGSEMSPQEYIMRQSEAFQKMNSEHHYVGVKKELRNSFENESRDPQTKNGYEVWTDRKDPKNVEEYAYSGFEGNTVNSRTEELKKLLDSYQNENGYGNSSWKRDLKEAKDMYELGQIDKQYYDDWVNRINNSYNEEISRIKRDLEATIRQKEIDPLNGGKVFDVTYPKETIETPIINAENNHWTSIPFNNVVRDAPNVISHYPSDYAGEVSTNNIVNAARRNGYGITHIDNVMDTYNGTMLNETIIGEETPIKSVLGNTGSFDINGSNKWKLYRSWLPWFLGGSTAATLYNKSK